jgi:hypothetical protein
LELEGVFMVFCISQELSDCCRRITRYAAALMLTDAGMNQPWLA